MARTASETGTVELTYDDFVTGIFVTLHQRGIRRMIPPELDEFNYSDQAIVAAYNHLDANFPDVKARFYQTYCYPGVENPHSCEWQRKLHELGYGLFTVHPGVSYLELLGKPYPSWERPGTARMWDELADAFCNVADPILL